MEHHLTAPIWRPAPASRRVGAPGHDRPWHPPGHEWPGLPPLTPRQPVEFALHRQARTPTTARGAHAHGLPRSHAGTATQCLLRPSARLADRPTDL